MLIDNFFKIVEYIEAPENNIEAAIELIVDHAIYKGHFPDMPVVPGVCQIQIIKEVLNSSLKQSFQIVKSNNCKFVNLMKPSDIRNLKCHITYSYSDRNEISFSGELLDENLTYIKLKGVARHNG